MSFNKSFNLTQFVKDIPSAAIRKQVWLSMVGSVNASLFAAADAIVQKLQAAGYHEFKELDRREFAALISGPETGAGKDVIAANKKLFKLHVEWRYELLHSTMVTTGRKADDDLGSIQSTITMMTGPQRERDINKEAVPMLASLGITVTADMIAAAKKERLNSDNHFANLRKQRAGAVEYVIDNVFAVAMDDEDDENYSQLDSDVKEYLANKLMASLNRALQTCINNTLFGRSGDTVLGVGDHIIIQRLMPDLIEQMSAPKAPKAKRVKKVAAKKVQRAPRPVQTEKVTTTLDNGIKVTTAA
jgi:hypothetical protein